MDFFERAGLQPDLSAFIHNPELRPAVAHIELPLSNPETPVQMHQTLVLFEIRNQTVLQHKGFMLVQSASCD